LNAAGLRRCYAIGSSPGRGSVREDNLSFFQRRLAQEEAAMARAGNPAVASVHRELAEQYRALIEEERLLELLRA
jgi:hypothetical protein